LYGRERLSWLWQLMKLLKNIQKKKFFGLVSQSRRSAVSIPSNIAEGRFRGTKKDFLNFLRIAYASGAELETQLEIAKKLPKTKNLDFQKTDTLLLEVMKMLRSLNPEKLRS